MTTQRYVSPVAGQVSTGLMSLCFVARFHAIRANPTALREAVGCGNRTLDIQNIIQASALIGLSARLTKSSADRITHVPLPAIAELKSGQFVSIVKVKDNEIILFDPTTPNTPISIKLQDFFEKCTCNLILLKRVKKTVGNGRFGFHTFLPVILKYRNILCEILIASFIIQLLSLATPLLTQIIIDKVVVHHNINTLYVLGTGMLFIVIFEAILTSVRGYLMGHTALRIDSILNGRVFSHLLKLPLNFFEARRIGGTINGIHELETIRSFMAGGGLSALLDVAFTAIFIGVMLFYSTLLTLIILGSIPLLALISLASRPWIRKKLEEKNDIGAENHAFLVEVISGIHTLKSLAIEAEIHRRWQERIGEYCKATFKISELVSHAGAASQVIQRISTLTVLCVGAVQVIEGNLTVGQLIAFQMLSSRAVQPMMRIVQLWQQFQQVALSVDRLGDIMNFVPESIGAAVCQMHIRLVGHVEFQNVKFQFSGRESPAINRISFDVTPGQIVAIIGRSGSGKSTLTKLLQGIYKPSEGKILIDGVNLQHSDLASVRRQIGIVLQENFLFEGTVRENILIHMPMATDEDLIAASKLAGAHDFISTLPNGYETTVGERGGALSGGQRQRVAIARALIGDPRILVFDEATSALDDESEAEIRKNFGCIAKNRTVFIISHRLHTLRHADRFIVLENGNLAESGTHEELIVAQGIYYQMINKLTES